MKAHFRYLMYVLRHKLFVFWFCLKYGLVWQGIIHDLSKFHPVEWFPYVDYFYGGPFPEQNYGDVRAQFGDVGTKGWVKQRFDAAWNHHQKVNPHHWQYWVLTEDSGKVTALPMPLKYRQEMLSDWRGAGMAIKGFDDTRNWYLANKDRMMLHADVRAWVEKELWI